MHEQRTRFTFADLATGTIPQKNARREFDIFPGRTWRHVAEWLGSREDGQLTARWSQHLPTGRWYVSEGWKRPNKGQPLNAAQVAFVESVIVDAPVSS